MRNVTYALLLTGALAVVGGMVYAGMWAAGRLILSLGGC